MRFDPFDLSNPEPCVLSWRSLKQPELEIGKMIKNQTTSILEITLPNNHSAKPSHTGGSGGWGFAGG